MDYIDTIARIHAKMLNQIAETESFYYEAAGDESLFARDFRAELKEELDQLEADKQDFLELSAQDPIQAVKKYYEYLFPEQLGVKHELQQNGVI